MTAPSLPSQVSMIAETPSPEAGGRPAASRDPVLLAILVLQAALALPVMATRTLWLDEAYSAVLARRSFAEIHEALRHDSGPPLYYALLRGWRAIFGESPLALRSLSLVFALGCTVVLYRLASRRFDRATARMAAALFAVLPIGSFYAAEARNYTLLALLGLLLAALLADGETRRPLRLAALVAVLVLTVYNHSLGWFVIAAALGGAALAYRRRVVGRWLAVPLAVTAAAFLPWIPVLREQAANIQWVRSLWSPWSPVQSLAASAPFGHVPVYLDLPRAPGAWGIASALLWLVPVIAAAVALSRRRSPDLGFALAFLALGLVLPAVASALLQPMSLPGRHDFFLVPVVALVSAAGLRAAPRVVRHAYLALLLALGVWASVAYARQVPPRDERAWTEAIAARARAGDVVLCTGLTRPAAEYALAGKGLELRSFPSRMAEDLAHLDERWYLEHVDLRADAEAVLAAAAARLGEGGRLWIVTSPRPLNRPLEEALAAASWLAPEPPLTSARMGLRLMGERIQVSRWRKVASR